MARDVATYVSFILSGHTEKTIIWDVKTKYWETLGIVKWFGSWRRYAFFPKADTVFEKDCLRDIANFCESKTNEHYSNLKKVRDGRTK